MAKHQLASMSRARSPFRRVAERHLVQTPHALSDDQDVAGSWEKAALPDLESADNANPEAAAPTGWTIPTDEPGELIPVEYSRNGSTAQPEP